MKVSVTITISVLVLLAATASIAAADEITKIQLGPRPFYLIDQMPDGPLKQTLEKCANNEFKASSFSIAHRGAPLQFPEHTRESYMAAARMGAGILECDVTFTKDRELVCRHSQCDLHTTTNILTIPELAAKCANPPDFNSATPFADVQCCTSDITLAEYKTLCGKMDAANPQATTLEDYLAGTAHWRTDLYSSCATVLSHAESIELFKTLGVQMTPELKAAKVDMPYQGDYSQENYAQQMIDEYKAAAVPAQSVWPQSFNLDDIRYWIEHEPDFARQAVFLDGRRLDSENPDSWTPAMDDLTALGVRIIAPPMAVLLKTGPENEIIPSEYAIQAKKAGLDIITWTLERSGRIVEEVLSGNSTYYYKSTLNALNNDGDIMLTLDALSQKVGIKGIFSDWPATVTYYANCMNIE